MLHPLLDPDRRPIVGHRGNPAYAPENTMESVRQALAGGAECVELDVRLSADGVPVVMHDPTLDRTTDIAGPVASLSAERIRAADAAARFTRDDGRTFPYRGKGLRVPTFEDVLTELVDVPPSTRAGKNGGWRRVVRTSRRRLSSAGIGKRRPERVYNVKRRMLIPAPTCTD